MTLQVGIDEAGYGPRLGPLVVAGVALRLPGGGDAEGLALPGVADSKTVYRSRRDLARLEASVLGLLLPDGRGDTADLERRCGRPCPVEGYPWYGDPRPLPIAADRRAVTRGAARLGAAGGGRGQGPVISAFVIDVAEFNRLLPAMGTKAGFLALAARPILDDAWREAGAATVVFDKHGGRNRYAEVLRGILPGSEVRVIEEGRARSAYVVEGGGRCWRVAFEARADARHPLVSLASMVAKYVREVHMHAFNGYWAGVVPGVRPTAGYPVDAARFLGDIESARARLGIDRGILVRAR